MPLHEDDVTRPGNLTDHAYRVTTEALILQTGVTGLHTIPEDVLAAAIAALEDPGTAGALADAETATAAPDEPVP